MLKIDAPHLKVDETAAAQTNAARAYTRAAFGVGAIAADEGGIDTRLQNIAVRVSISRSNSSLAWCQATSANLLPSLRH